MCFHNMCIAYDLWLLVICGQSIPLARTKGCRSPSILNAHRRVDTGTLQAIGQCQRNFNGFLLSKSCYHHYSFFFKYFQGSQFPNAPCRCFAVVEEDVLEHLVVGVLNELEIDWFDTYFFNDDIYVEQMRYESHRFCMESMDSLRL